MNHQTPSLPFDNTVDQPADPRDDRPPQITDPSFATRVARAVADNPKTSVMARFAALDHGTLIPAIEALAPFRGGYRATPGSDVSARIIREIEAAARLILCDLLDREVEGRTLSEFETHGRAEWGLPTKERQSFFSMVLSNLGKAHLVRRIAKKRNGQHPYVLPAFVNGRATVEHRGVAATLDEIAAIDRDMRDLSTGRTAEVQRRLAVRRHELVARLPGDVTAPAVRR